MGQDSAEIPFDVEDRDQEVVFVGDGPYLADIEVVDGYVVILDGGYMDVDIIAGGVVLVFFAPVGCVGCPAYMRVFAGLVGVDFDVVGIGVFYVFAESKDNSGPKHPIFEVLDGLVIRNCGGRGQSMSSASWRLFR